MLIRVIILFRLNQLVSESDVGADNLRRPVKEDERIKWTEREEERERGREEERERGREGGGERMA